MDGDGDREFNINWFEKQSMERWNGLMPRYTRTHVARIHVSRTSNLYPDTYISTDTCRRIQVARPRYL